MNMINGCSLFRADLGREYVLSGGRPYSYQSTVNKGIVWSADFHYPFPWSFAEYTKFFLKMQISSTLYVSAPLVVSTPSEQKWGKGVGLGSSVSGTCYATWCLSQKATVKSSFTKTTADLIIQDLLSNITLTCTVDDNTGIETPILTDSIPWKGQLPTFYVKEYDCQEGSRLSHITYILQKGGCCFWIDHTGAFCVAPMDYYVNNGLGTNWINGGSCKYNPALNITRLQLHKSSKLQTHYEFPFTDMGFKTVSFSTPMKSITVSDASNFGYVDTVTYFNESNQNHGQQVGSMTIMRPNDHPGVTYPVGHGAPPIKSASFWIYAPKDSFGNYMQGQVDARVIFDGIPYDYEAAIDHTFTVEEDRSGHTIETTEQAWNVIYTKASVQHTVTMIEVTVAGDFPQRNISYYYYEGLMFVSPEKAILSCHGINAIDSKSATGSPVNVSYATAHRPADSNEYIDAAIVPDIAHAQEVIPRLLYEKLKGYLTVEVHGEVPLPMLEPLSLIPATDYSPQVRIESVKVEQKGTSCTCFPPKWW